MEKLSVFIVVSETNLKGSIYPIWSSCSFKGTNYYEEASNSLEEALNFALIPESSCLLNDVTYPLDHIDEFYWTPWKSVEYDSKFFIKEFEKIEEMVAKLCANVTPISENYDIVLDEEFPESDHLLDTANFEELKLQMPSDSSNCALLEVPYIRNPALQLKSEKALDELLRNIPPMELEDIFKRENTLIFDTNFEENFLENEPVILDQLDVFPDNFEQFKEIVLPKIATEDLSLEFLSISSEQENLAQCSRNAVQYAIKCKNSPAKQVKFSKNLTIDGNTFIPKDIKTNSENILKSSTVFQNKALEQSNKQKTESSLDLISVVIRKSRENFNASTQSSSYVVAPSSGDIKNFIEYKNFENNYAHFSKKHGDASSVFNRDDESEMQFDDKSSIINFDCELATSEIEETNSDDFIRSDDDNCNTNVNCQEEMDDNMSEIWKDDFFYEAFMDSNDSNGAQDTETESNSFQYASEPKSVISTRSCGDFSTSIQSREKSFMEKLSELDLVKEIPDYNTFIPKDIRTDSENVLKSSTVFRNKALVQSNEQKNDGTFQNEIKNDASQIQQSFDLMNSFLCAKKKENELALSFELGFSDSQASEKNDRSAGEFKKLIDDVDTFSEKLPSGHCIKTKLQQPEEDISIKLPDDYVKLILAYENSITFYVQKLALWEKFKLSPDLTIMDISLDKTRFLLNQEVKSCRDRSINPLEGGVRYSHYIQLLVLHGILKSLNCLIHFGAELAISSLYEYEAKHNGLLKGCFQNLIYEVSYFVENLSNTDSFHPKIKELSLYLQRKYYFCKENMIAYKVVIVLKEHLNFFYSSFEAYLKTLLPEINIDLIPESDYLEQETDHFSAKEEQIYVVCVSSISKNIIWKNITLLIEYQTDKNVCWKTVCEKENILHLHIIFCSLPLKTLDEIKNLPVLKDPPCNETVIEIKQMPIVISASAYLEYNMNSLCNLEKKILVFERDYKKHLPDMYFADVCIDYRTSVIIIRLTEFPNDCAVENLCKKVFNLQLKYDIFWIIIHDDLYHRDFDNDVVKKIQQTFIKFYFTVVTMKIHHSFKVKFLYGNSNDDIKRCVATVLSKNLKCPLPEYEKHPVCSFTTDMTKDELFLVSCPSFNPFIASFILSYKTPLFQLMNLKLQDLCKKFHPVPEKFLKHFYSLIHETLKVNPSYQDFHESIYGNLMKSDQISRNSEMITKKFNSNTNELINFITCLEKHHSFEDRLMTDFAVKTPKNKSEDNNVPATDDYSEMSVEEIDRDYRALKLQDMADASFDVGFENNFDSQPITPSYTVSSHSISPDSVSPVDKYLIVGPPKKKKCDNFAFQEDFNNTRTKENQTHSSSKLKISKEFYQNATHPIEGYTQYKSIPFHESIQASQAVEDAGLQNAQIKQIRLSQCDDELILQDNLNNVHIKKSQTAYLSESKSTKIQNLKSPMRNYLPSKSSSFEKIVHAPSILRAKNPNIQNVQVKEINPQYNNKLISQKDFNNICIKESQMCYSGESNNTKHSYCNLKYPMKNHFPYKSDEIKPASEPIGNSDANNLKYAMRNHFPYKSHEFEETELASQLLGSNDANSVKYPMLDRSDDFNETKHASQLLGNSDANNLKICPMRNQLPHKSYNFDENKHVSQLLVDGDAYLEHVQVKQLNLSQYKYRKRKNADFDFPSQSKFTKYGSQNLLTTSPRLQKGQSSRTVCKQVSFKNSPIFYGNESNDFSSSCESLYSSSLSQMQTSLKFGGNSSDFSEKVNNIRSENIDSSWLSQSSITLTPRTSRRLAYEKMPGKKGQTRLIFY